jgi:UDP-N-acetylglucosamine 2-epimerase (non-hydrolysing)
MRIALIAGARPNFVKIAALKRALTTRDGLEVVVVNTGQHYDDEMSSVFLRELEIGSPEVDLGVGSGSHAVQTAKIMTAFDAFLDETDVDLVVVVGDVNSTAACSLTAVKRSVPVAHVEAGLRSGDWTMPEEINRIVTDTLSRFLFTPSRDANENLLHEGHSESDIYFVGNVMVDTLLRFRDVAAKSDVLHRLEVKPGEYCVLTLHRPSNVDAPEAFSSVLDAVARIADDVPVVYPMHPRSSKMLAELGLAERAESTPGLRLTGPMNYLEFIELESRALFVMTDSGGVQEETTVLGVPCLTLRPNTERPVTIVEGTNRLVGTDPGDIVEAAEQVMSGQWPTTGRVPELWDGHAAERIADVFTDSSFLSGNGCR